MAYLDGELAPERAANAAAHLEQCRDCQAVAADLQGVSRRLLDWHVEEPVRRMSAEVRAALGKQKGRDRRRRWTFPAWKWVLGAATAAIAALIISTPRMNRAVPVDMARTSALVGARSVPMQTRVAQTAETAALKPMIARTAEVTLTARDFERTRTALEDVLKRHRGYIGQLNVSTPAGAGRSIEATLRVPADQLEAALAEIRKLGRVESESQNGEEVTAQYVDLDARLNNSRNTEQRLTELLRERTGKLSDVLAVEVEISRVRGEIERMEAEQKSLLKRVDFATLNVSVHEDYQAQLNLAPSSMASRMWNAAVSGYRSLVEGLVAVVVFLLSWGPSLLIWSAILFFPARAAWRKMRARVSR